MRTIYLTYQNRNSALEDLKTKINYEPNYFDGQVEYKTTQIYNENVIHLAFLRDSGIVFSDNEDRINLLCEDLDYDNLISLFSEAVIYPNTPSLMFV